MYNHLLDTFIIVAKCGSFQKASEKLFISSTSIMKQMNKLEHDLQVRLFKRTSKGIELTMQGEYIYKESQKIMHLSNTILKEAKKLSNETTIKIKIGSSELFPSKLLSNIWNIVQSEWPNFDLEFISFEDSRQGQHNAFSQLGDKFTFFVGTYLSTFLGTRYNAMELVKLPLCIGVPIHHKLQNKKVLAISDLYNQEIIMLKNGVSQYLDDARIELQKHKEITIIDVDEYDINTFNLCIKRNCVIITSPNWIDIHPMIKTIKLNWDYKVPFGIIYSTKPSKETLRFLRIIFEVYQTHPCFE